ncbi:MAG: 4Fe-4S binding protein [Thermoplasmata archaeon]|nr:MAG: 4Fe-4S binding protein [Thermoplasmata archaeon]
MKRKIIKIDDETCTGCGVCIPNCPEGALQLIDDKARLISDLFCDGLGACIGECPEGAISIEEREAEPYDERKVMANIVKQGTNTIKAHLAHLKDHNQDEFYNQAVDYLKEQNIDVPQEEDPQCGCHTEAPLQCGCPGSAVQDLREEKTSSDETAAALRAVSRLQNWPVQITLVPPSAPYFQNADLLITADCAPFAYPSFHSDFLKDKVLVIGCPKLDEVEFYKEKLAAIFSQNSIKSITIVHMEVPCCFGLRKLVDDAIKASGKDISLKTIVIGIQGDILEEI